MCRSPFGCNKPNLTQLDSFIGIRICILNGSGCLDFHRSAAMPFNIKMYCHWQDKQKGGPSVRGPRSSDSRLPSITLSHLVSFQRLRAAKAQWKAINTCRSLFCDLLSNILLNLDKSSSWLYGDIPVSSRMEYMWRRFSTCRYNARSELLLLLACL